MSNSTQQKEPIGPPTLSLFAVKPNNKYRGSGEGGDGPFTAYTLNSFRRSRPSTTKKASWRPQREAKNNFRCTAKGNKIY